VVYTARKSTYILMSDRAVATYRSFGELLKYLRRRAQLTQQELSIAVGYSEAHISRLEQNQRLPDVATVAALFIPALDLRDEPEIAVYLIQLATNAHGESDVCQWQSIETDRSNSAWTEGVIHR